MFRKPLTLACVLVLSHSLLAQEALQRRPHPDPVKPTPCPHPYSQTLNGGGTGASSPVLTEFPANVQPNLAGSVWNQTAVDKFFGHTFRFKPRGECCAFTGGTLQVTIKALRNGTAGGSSSNNDAVNVYANGTRIGLFQPWLNGVSAGAQATGTFPLQASDLANGMISFFVQDDTAVVSAQLVLDECCLRKQK